MLVFWLALRSHRFPALNDSLRKFWLIFIDTLLENVNQTLTAIDRVLVHTNHTLHTNILDQTIAIDNNRTILEPTNLET